MHPQPDRSHGRNGRAALWLVRLFSLLAAGVALYLGVTSRQGLPLGCGSGSGCSEVLHSRWSALFGVPVGFYALAAYTALLAATFAAASARPPVRRAGRFLLLGFAVAIAGAAVWFVLLQLAVLRAVCVWCMTDHALGLAAAGAAGVWFVHDRRAARAVGREPPGLALPVAAGIALVLALILLQVGFSRSALARLPAGENADTGPGPGRRIAVLGGKLQIDVGEVPLLGSPDAEHLLVLLYDYACPHCRATHRYLVDGLDRYSGQYGIVLLPMPLDGECNPTVAETEPRFEDSCELARLALAVWRARPSAFRDFDAWLYARETPRSAEEARARARARAESLTGAAALDGALADPWVNQRLAANVQAYAASGAGQIPVLLSPAIDAVVGRPESAEELFQLLEEELRLRAAAP